MPPTLPAYAVRLAHVDDAVAVQRVLAGTQRVFLVDAQRDIERERIVVAETSDGTVCGAVWWSPRDPARYIKGIAVHRNYRRRGVGRALLEAVGYGTVALTLRTPESSEANLFYQSLGFRKVDWNFTRSFEIFNIYEHP